MEESDSFKNIVDKLGAARKKICVLCLGCPESHIDSARVQVFLKRNGCIITENLKEADLIFFRTCGFTKLSELEVLEAIRHIKSKMQRDAILIPWGCLPKINPNALNHNYITLSEEDVWKLNKLLAVKEPTENVNANFLLPKHEKNSKIRRVIDFPRNLLWPFERNHPIVNTSKYGLPYFIKASTGCYGGCTYCAIRLSRGKTKSKRIEEVASEFNRGLKLGFKDFRLVGTDLGAYGRDRGCTLVDLLNIITEEEGKYVLSLRNVNPYWLIEMYNEMKPILSSGKIRYIASSVELGSNRILKK